MLDSKKKLCVPADSSLEIHHLRFLVKQQEVRQTYYDETDRAVDAIMEEITRLENQIYDQEGVIGWLKSQINSLGNYIETLLN